MSERNWHVEPFGKSGGMVRDGERSISRALSIADAELIASAPKQATRIAELEALLRTGFAHIQHAALCTPHPGGCNCWAGNWKAAVDAALAKGEQP